MPSYLEAAAKKLFYGLLCLVGLIGLTASPSLAADRELLLYCGAGLRQPVDELLESFQRETGLGVAVEFAGSGQLLARYQATGRGDVLLPGSSFYVEKLARQGQVVWSRPVVLHVPVIAFPKKTADRIKSFGDLSRPGLRVGLGDPKAMALGRMAEEILKNSGLGQAILKNVVVRAATVKQLAMYVLKGDVDAAIIARADVFQNRDQLDLIEIDPAWYKAEIVTAASLKASRQPELARRLAEFLSSPQAVETFGRHGFLPVK